MVVVGAVDPAKEAPVSSSIDDDADYGHTQNDRICVESPDGK